ncbi:hypothetical protein RP20_CCG006478 [Aedes albopictus]|nr:hypothetical protein RP20_CCG006478 [Aedes albopictus]
MDDFAKSIVSKLFYSAWFKLQILNAVPSSTEQLLDGTGSYSIRQLLEQTVGCLETMDRCLWYHGEESSGSSSGELLQTSDESGGSMDTFDLKRYERYCKEQRILTRQMNNLLRLHELTHLDHAEEYSLEVSKNILVQRWESARLEQLSIELQDRYQALEQTTHSSEHHIRSNLKACRLIEQFYGWQLDKVQHDIDQWMERFDREKDDLDGRFQRARAKKRHWEALKEEVQLREQEIERLQQLEDEHHKRIDYRELCWNSAIRIQAWWRGVIVRKGINLGARRKTRRKKKTKGKKNKKSKVVRKSRKR